jgi:hypothetical protein
MLAVAGLILVWTILYASDLLARIMGAVLALIWGAYGVRRLRVTRQAQST